MIKLNIEQQKDEMRDIDNFVKDLDPLAVVELQSQQIKRLLFFARKGVISFQAYKSRLNPNLNNEISLTEAEE